MKVKIRLLEEKVHEIVGRLKTVSDERDRLREEVEALRQRLEAVDRDREDTGLAPEQLASLVEIRGALSEAIAELRND